MLRQYLVWSAINSFSTSVSSVISTNSMLSSITTITPSYQSIITTNYIGKDIIGQVGGLLYAWKTGKGADSQSLKYITKGAVVLQASFYIENAAPLITDKLSVLPFLGFSSALKNISFISIGAVNAKNLQRLCKSNIGECYSKAASINTISSTLGMICGIGVIYFIPSYTFRTTVILPAMSVISIYSLRKATIVSEEKSLTHSSFDVSPCYSVVVSEYVTPGDKVMPGESVTPGDRVQTETK